MCYFSHGASSICTHQAQERNKPGRNHGTYPRIIWEHGRGVSFVYLSLEAKAARMVKQGQYSEAAQVLAGRIGTREKGSVAILNLMAVCKAKLGQLYEAKTILKQLDHEYPGNPRVLNNLGNVALFEGDAPTALKLYKDAAKLSPWSSEPRFNMFLAYRELGEVEKSLCSYHEFVLIKRISYLSKVLVGGALLAAAAALIHAWLMHP
jgi:tetratricopeptide (TPR) repeat protein